MRTDRIETPSALSFVLHVGFWHRLDSILALAERSSNERAVAALLDLDCRSVRFRPSQREGWRRPPPVAPAKALIARNRPRRLYGADQLVLESARPLLATQAWQRTRSRCAGKPVFFKRIPSRLGRTLLATGGTREPLRSGLESSTSGGRPRVSGLD